MNDVLYALWLFVPAGAANVTPILASRLPLLKDWDYPFDFGRHFRGKRIFGANKTWRGVIAGVAAALATFSIQQELAPHLGSFSNYLATNEYTALPLALGFLLGFGALMGDAVESFFKRQFNVQPGKSWVPFDQLDYIIGASICASLVIVLSLKIYLWIFVIWFIMHIIFSYIGYRLGLKKSAI